jgi:hypothetical protein
VNQEQADKIVEEMSALYPWMSWATWTVYGGSRIIVVGNGARAYQAARVEISHHHPNAVFRAEVKLYDPSYIVRLERYGHGPTARYAVNNPFDYDHLFDDAEKWRARCVDELRAKADELRSDLADVESALRELGAGAEE